MRTMTMSVIPLVRMMTVLLTNMLIFVITLIFMMVTKMRMTEPRCKCLVPTYHLCIPKNETVQPPFFQNRIIMFSLPIPTLIYCICERFIYFQDRSVYFAAAKYVDLSWEYANRSQTHECENWDWEAAQVPEKEYINGIFSAVHTHTWPPACCAQIPPRARSTVTGCTGSSVTRRPARGTGRAGTVRRRNSSASAACSTTRRHTPATGRRTSPAARNTVRIFSFLKILTVIFPLHLDISSMILSLLARPHNPSLYKYLISGQETT